MVRDMTVEIARKRLSGKLIFADSEQLAAVRLLNLAAELSAAIGEHEDLKARCKRCGGAGYIPCGYCGGDGAIPFRVASPSDDSRDLTAKLQEVCDAQ